MRQVILPGTRLSVSRFGFGTASLHYLGSITKQAAHLEKAALAGFTHFDTAPLYGFGEAERAIGSVFAGETSFTIATKVGLYPPGGCDQSYFAVLARKAAGKVCPPLSKAIADYAVDRASASLEGSLTRLCRERVDVLLLHDPIIGLVESDEWQRWLESETDRIGYVGVAGPADSVKPFVAHAPHLTQITQVRDGIKSGEADFMAEAKRPLQFTYGYFSSEAGTATGSEVLDRALSRNRTGAVIVTSRSASRILDFAEASVREHKCIIR